MFLKLAEYIYWQLISGLSNLLKKLSSGFLKSAKFVGVDQITFKNCDKSSWIQVNKILLTLDRPEQFFFFLYAVFSGIKLLWDEAAFPKLIIFLKNQLIEWIACYSLFSWCLKLPSKIFRKRSHRICSNFDIIEAIMAGTNSLKRFLKKTLGTEKHKDK